MHTPRWFFLSLLAALLLVATPVLAQTHVHGIETDLPPVEDQDQAYNLLISAIDIIPNPEAMKDRWPDIVDRLSRTAEDRSLSRYERLRATSFLGNYQEPAARHALVRLTADAEPRIRGLAYYALGLAFLDADQEGSLLSHIIAGLEDPEERVRHDVVRALGYSRAPEAVELLEHIVETGDERIQRIAHRSLHYR